MVAFSSLTILIKMLITALLHVGAWILNFVQFQLQLEIHFGDDQVFTFDKVLAGIIKPENSKVTYAATKVEV